MDAKERSIQEVFCADRVLRIPFFQRSYTWREENWERFDSDMMNLIGRDIEHKYFLGSLILKDDKITEEERDNYISSKYTVIDGQQRLTTLSIYLKALVNRIGDNTAKNRFASLFLYSENTTPKLNHNINDREAYRDIMLDSINNYAIYKSDKVLCAYNYFINKFSDRNMTELIDLLKSIYSNITFVVISLNDKDDEQQIFDTINSLGVKLTIDELMKNFLYDAANEAEYNHNWKPIFDSDTGMRFWKQNDASTGQAATDKNTVIYNFFYDFVRIKMWDYNLTPRDREQFVRRDSVLETCKAFVEHYGTNKLSLANEIIEYAKLYMQYFNRENLYNPVSNYPSISRIACISMEYSNAMRPYLLYILRTVDDEAQRNDIFKFLEIYHIRRAICKSDTKTSDWWTDQLIRQRINTADRLRQHVMSWSSEINNHMPSNDEVRVAITSNDLSKSAKLIMYLYETKVAKHNVGYNYFLEKQIIPTPGVKNRVTYPPYTDVDMEKQRKRIVKTLGNYILLNLGIEANDPDEIVDEQKVVGKNDNKIFSQKKSSVSHYVENVQCMQWFKHTNSWSENDINRRNEDLAKYINEKLWAI